MKRETEKEKKRGKENRIGIWVVVNRGKGRGEEGEGREEREERKMRKEEEKINCWRQRGEREGR